MGTTKRAVVDLMAMFCNLEVTKFYYTFWVHFVLVVGVFVYISCFIWFGRRSVVVSRSEEGSNPSRLVFFGIFVVGVYTFLNFLVVFYIIGRLYWFGEDGLLQVTWKGEFRFALIRLLIGGLLFSFSCLYFLPGFNSRPNIVRDRRPELALEFESFLLVMCMLLGMSLCLGTNNLITFYVCLELQSFCLILLLFFGMTKVDYNIRVNYFFVILFSSIILLVSFVLLYLMFGTLVISELFELVRMECDFRSYPFFLGTFAILLFLTSLLVKVGLFPMHVWIPDIYEISSEFFLSLISTVSKIFGFMIIYQFVEGLSIQPDVVIIVYIYSVLSIGYGTLGALFEIRFRRLLGFSAIAHIGYAFLVISSLNSMDAYQYGFFYVIVYILSVFPILCFLMSAKEDNSRGEKPGKRPSFKTGGRVIETVHDLRYVLMVTRSYIGVVGGHIVVVIYLLFSTVFFGLAGIPPFAGFLSKFFMLSFFLASEDYVSAVLVGFFSIVGVFYYLRVIKYMFFLNNTFKLDSYDLTGLIVIDSYTKFILLFFGVVNILSIFLVPIIFLAIRIALLF